MRGYVSRSPSGRSLQFRNWDCKKGAGMRAKKKMAERGGFEPPVQEKPVRRVSNPLPSATQPPLRIKIKTDIFVEIKYPSIISQMLFIVQ